MLNHKKLRKIMAERGMSGRRLAREAGMTSPRICNLTNKDENITTVTLMRLCNALGCTPNDLLGD